MYFITDGEKYYKTEVMRDINGDVYERFGNNVICHDDRTITLKRHPVLFNTEAHIIYTIKLDDNGEKATVRMNSVIVYHGIVEFCEDFIYSLAGHVMAKNPMAKVTP